MRVRLSVLGVVLGLLACLPASAGATDLYVSSQGQNTISVFSIGSGGALTPVACSTANCSTSGGTEQLVITPDNRFMYTANAGATNVSEFAIASGGSLGELCTTSCPGTTSIPLGMAVSPNGKFTYTADGGGTVSPFSVASNGTLNPIACTGSDCTAGEFPVGIAMSTNGSFVYTANQDSGNISEFSVDSGGSLSPLCTTACPPAPGDPIPIEVTPDGKFLYAGARDAGQVEPFSIASNGALTPITCATCEAAGLNSTLNGMAITPNGRFLYTANEDAESISAFSINSDGSLTPVTCAACTAGHNFYRALTVEPGSHYLYALTDGGQVVPFSINADGSLTAISCAPATCVTPQTDVDVFSIVTSPDQAPVAKFTHGTAKAGRSTSFNGSGSTAYQTATVARYDWSFGDGKKALNGGPKPKHRYAKPGTYKVTLTVTDSLGCSTSQVFTGQTMSCNGSSVATITHNVHVTAVKKATLSLRHLPSACVRASTTIGVRVHTESGSAPHKTNVSVDGHRVAHSQRLSFSVTISLGRLKAGSNTLSAVSVDRFGRRSKAGADIERCSTSAAFTG